MCNQVTDSSFPIHSSMGDYWEKMDCKTMVLDVDLTEDDTQNMLHHINQLIDIR